MCHLLETQKEPLMNILHKFSLEASTPFQPIISVKTLSLLHLWWSICWFLENYSQEWELMERKWDLYSHIYHSSSRLPSQTIPNILSIASQDRDKPWLISWSQLLDTIQMIKLLLASIIEWSSYIDLIFKVKISLNLFPFQILILPVLPY